MSQPTEQSSNEYAGVSDPTRDAGTAPPAGRTATTLHERIANANPTLSRGLVWCRKCGRCASVKPAECLRSGWPKCCSETMTIDAPEERP